MTQSWPPDTGTSGCRTSPLIRHCIAIRLKPRNEIHLSAFFPLQGVFCWSVFKIHSSNCEVCLYHIHNDQALLQASLYNVHSKLAFSHYFWQRTTNLWTVSTNLWTVSTWKLYFILWKLVRWSNISPRFMPQMPGVACKGEEASQHSTRNLERSPVSEEGR